jgi:hypothetical protein
MVPRTSGLGEVTLSVVCACTPAPSSSKRASNSVGGIAEVHRSYQEGGGCGATQLPQINLTVAETV